MHGYLDHHNDPAHFTVDELDETKLLVLRELVRRYLNQAIRSLYP